MTRGIGNNIGSSIHRVGEVVIHLVEDEGLDNPATGNTATRMTRGCMVEHDGTKCPVNQVVKLQAVTVVSWQGIIGFGVERNKLGTPFLQIK